MYLKHYRKLGATVLESAPLVHPLFPRSFNMSEGLVQLEESLRRQEKAPKQKMVVVQKCFRHYDVARMTKNSHLSFFEMGGYFEVGEIDRLGLILNLYQLLVETFKIDPERLWVTTFRGGLVEGRKFGRDEFVQNIWKQLLPRPEHLVEFGVDDNYWVQGGGTIVSGESKLCGPQTEVFYELTNEPCAKGEICLPNCECGRFLEISNNLLITHKIIEGQKIEELVNPAIESVVGIERLCAVIENKLSVFRINDIATLTPSQTKYKDGEARLDRIKDHLRALLFVVPEMIVCNDQSSRTRIVRGLIREMLTELYVLGFEKGEVVQSMLRKIAKQYETRYPRIKDDIEKVMSCIRKHERQYVATLEKAKIAIYAYLNRLNKIELSDEERWQFWKRYGIPIELQFKYFG